jgi:hypothetical protein
VEPLREQNRSSESGKRPLNGPTNELSSPPQAKRKTFNAMGLLPTQNTSQRDKKLKYAEKMATAYRLSAGLGEFTPEVHKSHETKDSKQGFSSQWMSNDQNSLDDEFDF